MAAASTLSVPAGADTTTAHAVPAATVVTAVQIRRFHFQRIVADGTRYRVPEESLTKEQREQLEKLEAEFHSGDPNEQIEIDFSECTCRRGQTVTYYDSTHPIIVTGRALVSQIIKEQRWPTYHPLERASSEAKKAEWKNSRPASLRPEESDRIAAISDTSLSKEEKIRRLKRHKAASLLLNCSTSGLAQLEKDKKEQPSLRTQGDLTRIAKAKEQLDKVCLFDLYFETLHPIDPTSSEQFDAKVKSALALIQTRDKPKKYLVMSDVDETEEKQRAEYLALASFHGRRDLYVAKAAALGAPITREPEESFFTALAADLVDGEGEAIETYMNSHLFESLFGSLSNDDKLTFRRHLAGAAQQIRTILANRIDVSGEPAEMADNFDKTVEDLLNKPNS